MSRWLRRLFVWLAVLALPVQGMAGVARWHCAAAATPAVVEGVAEHASHGHSGHHAHHADRDHCAGMHQDAAATSTSSDATGTAPTAPAAHKCSACAACTFGAAPPPVRAAVPQPGPESPERRAAPMPAVSFIAGGPERPPRRTGA